MTQTVIDRYRSIQAEIESACTASGRKTTDITLIGVVKGVAPQLVNEAYAVGVGNFAENYVQEALSRERPRISPDRPQMWHMIGHLQRNKVRYVTGKFALIHSVDSRLLAAEIARCSLVANGVQDILLQVKLDDRSETKFGVAPDDVLDLAEAIAQIDGIRLKGLMGIAPMSEQVAVIRSAFASLYNLYSRLPEPARQVLSMGMSADFAVAIHEGATHIRVGTALFGPRNL